MNKLIQRNPRRSSSIDTPYLARQRDPCEPSIAHHKKRPSNLYMEVLHMFFAEERGWKASRPACVGHPSRRLTRKREATTDPNSAAAARSSRQEIPKTKVPKAQWAAMSPKCNTQSRQPRGPQDSQTENRQPMNHAVRGTCVIPKLQLQRRVDTQDLNILEPGELRTKRNSYH